jgi:hypothetical protein
VLRLPKSSASIQAWLTISQENKAKKRQEKITRKINFKKIFRCKKNILDV